MTTGQQHIDAQAWIKFLLSKHFRILKEEHHMPTPNGKYIYDGEEFVIKPYKLDVYAKMPYPTCDWKYNEVGVELDGKVGHKTTKHQYNRDNQRTEDITEMYDGIFIVRFDSKQIVGRGYVNPKTKRRHSILTDAEILTELGVKCQHA